MSVRLAVHWAATALAAASISTAVVIPFTGVAARIVGLIAIAGVCLIGIALAPATRKDRP